MSPQAKRKSAAQKKKEAEVTEAKTEETKPTEQENPSDKPEVDESQTPEEQEENQSPPDEQEPKETQRGGRKVGKAKGQSDEDRSLSPYQPRHRPLQNAGLDQHAAEAERQAERDAEREEHNRRTGDASLAVVD